MTTYIILGIITLLNLYSAWGIKWAFIDSPFQKWAYIILVVTFVIEVIAIFNVSSTFKNGLSISNATTNLLMGTMFSLFVFKLLFAVFILIGDIIHLGTWITDKVVSQGEYSKAFASKRKFLHYVGMGLAAIPFSGLLYGVFKGRYDYRVIKESIAFKDLPASFDGLKVAQISDIHSGSFDSLEEVKRGLKMLQGTKPDIILLTGDLVNNIAEEMEPYIEAFDELTAPMGKFAVMGNHDYGEYVKWESKEAKQKNVDAVMEQYKRSGFTLLNNENVLLKKGEESIRLLGVENSGRHFINVGDFPKAINEVEADEFKILMSHDPHHWEDEVIKHEKHVHLTLSGHTHGSQFGVELPFLKWAPVQLRYNRWAGLYKEEGQYLYVNRGFGYIGYPGRFGIWPEITLLELKKA